MALLKQDIRVIVQKLVLDAQDAGFEQVYVASPEIDAEEMAFFNRHGISVSGETRPLFRAMHQLASYRGPRVEPPKPAARSYADLAAGRRRPGERGRKQGDPGEARMRTPRSQVISDADELKRLSDLKRPLAMKGLSEKIAHKTEHGLVALGLRDDKEVGEAFARIKAALAKADPEAGSILVEEMVAGGLEAIVGLQRDPVVGPVVVVGAGGILVELLDDAVVMMPPFTAEELDEAIAKTKLGRLLSGYRGKTLRSRGADRRGRRHRRPGAQRAAHRIPRHQSAVRAWRGRRGCRREVVSAPGVSA